MVRRALCSWVLLAAAACGRTVQPIDIATTTSVVNSGLLDSVVPQFRDYPVRIHAAGSGRALAMLADRVVDLVISHAPMAEQHAIARHSDWRYQKLAYNRFVIVGPTADPASVRTARGAVDAFKRMADKGAAFISRGDGSGTHERETTLWKLAGATPHTLISGASMAATLKQADNQLAYTLTDEATWRQLEPQLGGLAVLSNSDAELLNTYAVLYPGSNLRAERFAAWLTAGQGRELIAVFKIADQPAFTVWPSGCPDSTAAALPCQ